MELFGSLDTNTFTNALIVLEVVALVTLSAICSGLNIAVMSLDVGDLRRKAKLGNKQAKRVLPLRERTHLTLASILLTNVAAVSATSLVLTQVVNGWVAGVIATLLIVIFGEILPQALFARNTLRYASRFAPVLKTMIAVTYILSRPLESLLNRLFPSIKKELQSRSELGLVISEHLGDDSSELDESEIGIMKGALELSEKRARDIMTDIKHTYYLRLDTELDGPKIDEIKERGFSRVPILNSELTACDGVLLMKDLVDVDFDDNHYKVSDMPLHRTPIVGSMTALDTLLRKFLSSGSHLIPIERDESIVGIATIEDLIEEIFGQEIEDETDRIRRPISLSFPKASPAYQNGHKPKS
ncbi:MAG TPA: CNNM domain-containing protein [Candidatus Sulfotelmatobacter sp.]|nr:CNNM domain-containing protein [Candidatus Sulfotelmatobacter sp.]